MIKTILITGLDGSGKSTVFSKLEAAKLEHVTLISALHVDVETLEDSSTLKIPVQLLNAMSEEADANNYSELKALALFCAMILFERLVSEKTTETTRIVLCERHPLIDTFVYAQFYLPRLGSGSMNLEQMIHYNTKYETLFSFVLEQLPVENKDQGALAIFKFIKTFFAAKSYPDRETQSIFKTNLPDQIFFLKATPDVLMERISSRKVIEAHEKFDVLSQLGSTYESLFEKISNTENNTQVKYIDANSFESLDDFYKKLLTEITI